MFDSYWYDNLTKPFLQPPAWIFSPIWIFLYGTMLISLIIYSITITNKNKTNGYIYFILQMILNLLWSPVFFYMHKINIALAIIIVMDFLTILIINKFFIISKFSSLILVPYLCWIIFATYLNYQLYILN